MMLAVKYIVWILILYTGSVHSQNAEFQSLIDDFWTWRLQNNPEFASNVGNHEYDALLEDYSLDAFDNRKTAMEGFLSRLDGIDKANLTAIEKVTYDVLNDTLVSWIGAFKWRFYGPMNGISFLDGIQTNHGSRAGQLKFEREQDFRNFVERIYNYGHQFPCFFNLGNRKAASGYGGILCELRINQTMARMNKAVEMGTTFNTVSMTKVPGQLDLLLKFKDNETHFSFYAPFQDGGKMDELVNNNQMLSENRTQIRNQAVAGISYFLNQIERLKTYIVNTYIPNTRADLGVMNLPEGDQYYQACLKWHLSVDMTADEIYQKGLEEVGKLRRKIEEIMHKDGFEDGYKAYLEYLRNDDRFYLGSKAEILQRLKDILDQRILPKLPDYFKNIPTFELRIEEMPYDGPPGIYKNGAIDGSRPGIYYANVGNVRNSPTYGMPALLLHESDPGHHLQDGYALTSTSIPDFRKATDFSKYFAAPLHFPFYTAYSEGWAMYAEDLGEELGVYQNDYERIGKYASEIFRAARLVVDTGIHFKGWTKEHAVEYFLNNTANSRASLENEVDRYSTWPGQATSYMIGKLKFNEIRAKAMRELCSYFDIKEFHSVLLENGAMPLSILERLVDDWVQQVKTGTGKQDVCQTAGAPALARQSELPVLHFSAIFLTVFVNIMLN